MKFLVGWSARNFRRFLIYVAFALRTFLLLSSFFLLFFSTSSPKKIFQMNSPRSEEEEVTTTNTSDDETDEDPMIYTSTSMREMGRENIEIVEQGMHHALACELPLESCCMLCTKMKCVLTHINCCLRRRLKGCDVCRTVISIVVFHARVCQVQVCRIPFCHDIRAAMLVGFLGHPFPQI